MSKKVSPRKPELTPRQKKLIVLLPKVKQGKLSKKKAMMLAGYSENTANQQQSVLGGIRTNTVMQEALRKAGVTEDRIARRISNGLHGTGSVGLGYTKLGAELLDAFPVKKQINAEADISDLIKAQEATTADAA